MILPVVAFSGRVSGANFETITTVESHPAALAQCERFFAALSAFETCRGRRHGRKRQARGRKRRHDHGRASADARTAEIYGGKILREHIEDHAKTTRVLLCWLATAEQNRILAARSRLSLDCGISPERCTMHCGRLFAAVSTLLKIESRPIKDSPSEFNFYLDLHRRRARANCAAHSTRSASRRQRFAIWDAIRRSSCPTNNRILLMS